MTGPFRPIPCRRRCVSSLIAAIWLGSRPTHIGPSSVSMAARVAGKMRWPNASPQPVMPPSVSMRTSSMSMLVRGRPPSIGGAPSITIGRLRTSVWTRVIFMGDVPLDSRDRVPGVITRERVEQGMTPPADIDHQSVNRERFVEALDETTIGPEDARVLARLGKVRRVLVLSEDWCGTCLAHVPYVAKLVEGNASIEMRLFPRDQNPDVMDQYLKKGLYRSIPVFVFFDEHMKEVARFIESRPA